MIRILTAFWLVFFAATTRAEIVVIGNSNGTHSLGFTQLENIFMGRSFALPNGRIAKPINQSALRTTFYQKLTASSIEKVDAYWIQMTARGLTAPQLLSDNEAVLMAVNNDTDAIGYIDRKYVNNRVRILLILN